MVVDYKVRDKNQDFLIGLYSIGWIRALFSLKLVTFAYQSLQYSLSELQPHERAE